MNSGYLFNGDSIYDYCQRQLATLRVEASQLPHVDGDEVLLALRQKFELQPVTLNLDGITRHVEERGSGQVLITVSVPYSGSTVLLSTTPTSYSSQLPTGRVERDAVLLTVEGNMPSAAEVKAWEEEQLRLIEQWLEAANADAQQFYSSVATAAEKAVAERKAELGRLNSLRKELGAD